MKAINTLQTLILTGMLLISVNTLFASTDSDSKELSNEAASVNISILATLAPAVAPFEEITESTVSCLTISTFAPVAPEEATFEDAPDAGMVFDGLAPVLPAFASFEDEITTTMIDIASLAPATPLFADFE